jgi:hypothetical protein
MMSRSFWWSFLGLLGIKSCHLQTGIVWLLSFLFEFFLFLLPILLLWLGIPKLCWIRVEKMDTLVLFLQLEEMISVFPCLVDLTSYYWEISLIAFWSALIWVSCLPVHGVQHSLLISTSTILLLWTTHHFHFLLEDNIIQ